MRPVSALVLVDLPQPIRDRCYLLLTNQRPGLRPGPGMSPSSVSGILSPLQSSASNRRQPGEKIVRIKVYQNKPDIHHT